MVAMPSKYLLSILVFTTIDLVINHTWLMSMTELVRLKYRLYATPEEWHDSGRDKLQASEKGLEELQRVHNAHRNTTENSVYFILLGLLFVISSPNEVAATIWLSSFAVGRIGYTYAYLKGLDNLRGVFMSISLMSLFGMASYLLIGALLGH